LKLSKATSMTKKAAATAPADRIKKFRHPETGAEWSGQGMEPGWIKGQDKQQFVNPAWSAKKNKNRSASIEPDVRLNADPTCTAIHPEVAAT
jgi:DNA-binding protein H-NS